MNQRIVIILILLLICKIGKAQENIVIRTDRDSYVGGEELWFHINNHLIDSNVTSDLSKVVYVELLNGNNIPVAQNKLKLNDGSITSFITIPDTISTGHYIFRAYTRWMRNINKPDFSSKTLTVVNPFSKNAYPKQVAQSVSISDTTNSNNAKSIRPTKKPSLSIKTDGQKYGNREEVNVSLAQESIDLEDITVSVVKKGLVKPERSISTYHNGTNLIVNGPYEGKLLPEYKGELIEGQILNRDSGLPIKDEKLVISFVSQDPIFQFSTSDSLGHFRFVVNRYGKQEMVIQPYDKDTTKLNYKINLDPGFSQYYSKMSLPELSFTDDEVKLLNKAIVNMQINTIYSAHRPDGQLKDSIDLVAPFYGEAEIITTIDQFIELPTMEEVIKEIVPYTVLRKRKGEYSIKVFESKPLYPRDGETLTFVDGVPVNNVESILQMLPSELDRIEVVNVNYYMQNEELGRLVCFYTNKGNTGSLDFDTRIFRQARECYRPGYTFVSSDYSSLERKKSRLADYRNVLYFGSLEMSEDNKASFSFYTCDDKGEYEIIVEGIDENGCIQRSRTSFEVK